MAWMVDQRHYLDVLDPLKVDQIPAPAKRVAAFFGSIVEGVTAGWDDAAHGCAVATRCIGRIARRRCTERVVARIVPGSNIDDAGHLVPAEVIEWTCLFCGDYGHIHHWQDTPWNLRGKGNHLFPAMDVVVELEMTFDEYEAVATIEVLDTPARRVLAAGRVPEDRVILEVPRAWLTHLIGFITSEANHTRSKKKAALYEAVLDRAEGVV